MKSIAIAIAIALSAAALAAPALAQAPAPAAASAKLSVETTKISDIVANAAAKAIVVKELPGIVDYFDQIGEMTLTALVPMAQGAVTDDNLKNIQAEFDKLK